MSAFAVDSTVDRGVRKRGPARVERSERRVDRGLERERRFAALSFRRERVPVEVVVPRLRRVVEYGGISRRARGDDDLAEREPLVLRSGDQPFERVDVAGVVLAVVERNRPVRNRRFQGVVSIGQGRKRNLVHRSCSFR